MKIIKKIAFLLSAVVLIFSITSCGKKGDVIYTLNGLMLNKKDVDIFGFIYVSEHSLVDTDKLDDIYENVETYGEHYKNDLEEDIVLSALLSKEADENKILLSSDDKEKAEEKTKQLIARFGDGRLSALGITKDDIENIYIMKLRANSYAGSIGDEFSDVLDAASDENESQNDNNVADDRYIRVFQVTFPTVELDDSGIIKTNKNGELISISSGEISAMKTAAEEFAENARAGGNMEELLDSEPDSVTGAERVMKYSDLSDDYKAAVDNLSKDKVSTVIKGEYGYYVIKLLDDNDEEHAESIENYEKQLKALEAKDKLYERLLNTYVGSDKGYRNDELWNEITIQTYMK